MPKNNNPRFLKGSRFNRLGIDSDDAFNRAAMRKQDLDKSLEDPQVGEVERRGRAIRRKGRKT